MSAKTFTEEDKVGTAENKRYTNLIAKAKNKGNKGPPPLEGTPRFDQLPDPHLKPPKPEPKKQDKLSPETEAGLEAIAYQAAHAPPSVIEEEEEPVEVSGDDKLRESIEKRIEPIDIGTYLSTGTCIQRVPVIPGKLEVTFRTMTEYEEFYVDRRLAQEIDDKSSTRQYFRLQGDLGIACHIKALNGVAWPPLFDKSGEIDEEAINARLNKVRQLSSPVVNLITKNIQWFLDRVNAVLTAGVLGNG